MAETNGSSAKGQSTALHIHPSNEGSSAAPPPLHLDSVATSSVEGATESDRWPRSFDSIITALNLIVTLVLGLAGLKYIGRTTGLFHENPVPTYFLLIMTWVFILILVALKAFDPPRNGIWFHTLIRVALACGLISIVSSISIFLPHPYSFAPLVSLFIVSVILAWPILRSMCNWIIDHVKSIFDSISAKVANSCKSVFDNISAKVTNWQATQESCLPI